MPNETIDEITARLNKITMSVNSATTSPPGLSDRQRNEIIQIVTNILDERNPIMDEGSDVAIGTIPSRLEDLDKVPDIVKSLREFSGKPGEFNSWRKSVERVLDLYSTLSGTGRYYAILHTIRTKIIGEADTALESYRTPLDWSRIRKCLMVHYSDKRDIGTLEYQMNILCQGQKTVTEFYQTVYQMLSLILDKVSCLDLDERSLRAMTDTYREKALDTFIRGLNGDLPKLLSVREPTSLPQALHLCLKLDNMSFRRDYAQKGSQRSDPRLSVNTGAKPRFYPELANIQHYPSKYSASPQYNYQNPNYNMQPQRPQTGGSYLNQRPQFGVSYPNHRPSSGQQFPQRTQFGRHPSNFSRYQSRPEPMDVDKSLQFGPQQNQNFKRPAQFSVQAPVNKVQRNFHFNVTNTPEDQGNESIAEYDNANSSTEFAADNGDEYFTATPDDVQEEYQERGPDDIPANFIDINFLD